MSMVIGLLFVIFFAKLILWGTGFSFRLCGGIAGMLGFMIISAIVISIIFSILRFILPIAIVAGLIFLIIRLINKSEDENCV